MAGAGQQLAQQGLQRECLMMCRQLEQAQALALMLGELQHLVHLVSLLYMLVDHLHPFGRRPSPACHAQENHLQTQYSACDSPAFVCNGTKATDTEKRATVLICHADIHLSVASLLAEQLS